MTKDISAGRLVNQRSIRLGHIEINLLNAPDAAGVKGSLDLLKLNEKLKDKSIIKKTIFKKILSRQKKRRFI